MGEILKFRLSTSHQKTSVYVPFDTTWPKLKSLAFGFFNVDYSEKIDSIVVIDSNKMDSVVEKWNENNFNFQSVNLTLPGQDLVFVIHLEGSSANVPVFQSPTSPPSVQDNEPIEFPSSLPTPLPLPVESLPTSKPVCHEDVMTSTELELSSPLMVMSNFNRNTFKKLVSHEVPVNMTFEFDEMSDFLKCCGSGDAAKLEELLKDSVCADVSVSNEGLRGMFLASSLGHLSIMQALHKEGVAIDEVERSCQLSPLNVACLRNHEAVAQWLIDKQCNVSKFNKFGATPLHYICYHSMTSVLPAAITKSCSDLVSANGYGLTHYATGMGSFPVVEHLVAIGADVNTWDPLGNYPLHYSAASGVLESVYLLVEVAKCQVDTVNENGQTPFLVACRSGNLDVAKWLGTPKSKESTRGGGGANVFIEDRDWCGAMHGAAQSGNLELISYIASLDVSVTSKSKEGKLPINMTYDVKVIELLKKLEAEMWIRNENLASTKAAAVEPESEDEGDLDELNDSRHSSINAPVTAGGYADELDVDGAQARVPVVGANGFSFAGQAPVAAAVGFGAEDALAAGLSHEQREETQLFCNEEEQEEDREGCVGAEGAVEGGQEQEQELQQQQEEDDGGVRMHPDPDVHRFFKSCLNGDNDYVEWYISQDLDVCVSNDNGSQAIHFATQSGNLKAIQLLFRAGVELEVFNNKGVMPMAVACKTLQPGDFEVVKWLASQGTEVFSGCDDIDFKNEPMHILASCSFDCADLIDFLHQSCPLLKYNIKLMNKAEEVQWSMLHVAAMHGTAANVEAFFNIGMKIGPRLVETAYTPLHCAVLHSHPCVEMIALIVSRCTQDDILAEDNRGRTAIFLACLMGNFEAVLCIADAGFNSIASCNHAGNTCLHVAIQSGNDRLVEWIKENHPELNVRNKQGSWPHDFASLGTTSSVVAGGGTGLEIVREAFLRGDVDAINRASSEFDVVEESLEIDDDSQYPFLHLMSSRGYVEAMMYLVEKGAPLNVLDCRGWSVLHCAAANGHTSLVEYILFQHGVSVFDTCGDDGSSCLHLAIRGNHIDLASLLLQRGADVNCQDSVGNTPAHVAASVSDLSMLLLLRDNHASFLQKNGDLMSVLHAAVSGAGAGAGNGDGVFLEEITPIVDLLLKFGCEIDIRGKNNLTPFHVACANGNVELCNYLFEGGSNIRLTGGKDNLTAVHIAAVKDKFPVLEWLLSRGLRHDSISGDNKTPADMAYAAGNHDIYDWLLTNAPDVYTDRYSDCLVGQLFWAIDLNYLKFAGLVLQDFLDGAPRLDYCNDDGSTLMHAAAAVGKLSFLEGLFERGVGIEEATVNDHTPLHVACLHKHIGCVKALVILGAKARLCDTDGSTCLHMAVIKGDVDITRFFCALFSDVDIQNVNGWTPLHYCCFEGENTEMLNLLLQHKANIFMYSFDDETPFFLACKHGYSRFVHAIIVHVMMAEIFVADEMIDKAIAISEENGFGNIAQWLKNIVLQNNLIKEPLPDTSIFTFGSLTIANEKSHSSDLYSPTGQQELSGENDAKVSLSEVDYSLEVFLEAVQNEDFTYVNALLKAGMDVNSFNPTSKMSAMHIASLTGNLMIVQLLVNHGANMSTQNIGGLSPLHICCDRQHEDVAIFLMMMGASLTKLCNNGNTVLHMMASRSLCDAIYEIQSRKTKNMCDLGARNRLGQTALHLAVVAGSVDTCEALLALGCPIDNTDFDGQTPLLLACCIDNNALVTLLVSRGANVNHDDKHKKRPLHAACQTGNMLVAHSLIDAAAVVQCVTDTGDTLLHVCARNGKLLLLKWLHKMGLDLEARNSANQTPRDCAKANGNGNVVTWIDAAMD